MDRKECANGLQLIKVAAIKLRGKFSAVFIGALAMTTPLILSLFFGILMSVMFGIGWMLPVSIVVFAVLVAPLQMGYIKYFNNVLDGKQPRISEVYSYMTKPTFLTLRGIYIGCILLIMYILGGILWIMPAGFAVSFFSMVLFFLQKFEHPRLRSVMMDCATKMCGNRLAMFAYKLIFYFVYGMLFVVAGLMLLLIYTLLMDSIIISWIVSVCCAIVFIFLYTFVTVYFHSSNQIFFEDVLTRHEKKHQRKVSHASVNNTTAVGEDSQVVDKKEVRQKDKEVKVEESLKKEEGVGEEKKSVKKSTSTKSTTETSTKTTKISAKKTTSSNTKKTEPKKTSVREKTKAE